MGHDSLDELFFGRMEMLRPSNGLYGDAIDGTKELMARCLDSLFLWLLLACVDRDAWTTPTSGLLLLG